MWYFTSSRVMVCGGSAVAVAAMLQAPFDAPFEDPVFT
jgi:hypothetical protein